MRLTITEAKAGQFARAADLAFQPVREAKVDPAVEEPVERLVQFAKDLAAAGYFGKPLDLVDVTLHHVAYNSTEEAFVVEVRRLDEAELTTLAEALEVDAEFVPETVVGPDGEPISVGASETATPVLTEPPAASTPEVTPEPETVTESPAEPVVAEPVVSEPVADPPVEETADSGHQE